MAEAVFQFNEAEVLFQSFSWNIRLIRELLEIALMQWAINKEDGAKLSSTWFPAHTLMTSKWLMYGEGGGGIVPLGMPVILCNKDIPLNGLLITMLHL